MKILLNPIFQTISLLFLSSSLTYAEHNTTIENSYTEHNTTIDKTYEYISKEVLYWSDYLDNKVSQWLLSDEAYAACQTKEHHQRRSHEENIDAFFQNNKYLNETKDIYVRLRLGYTFYTRESNKLETQISAQLPFERCKKNWNIFIQDNNNGNRDEIKSTDRSNTGVGIRYYGKERFGIKSSYSLGLTKGTPYIRARYKFPFTYKGWKIEPIQSFQYSHKYFFDEETNIYFDKRVRTDDLFRVQLYHRSAYDLNGTDYGLTLQYFWNRGKNTGMEITQSFFGNTSYNHVYRFDKNYTYINNYVTSVSWRESIWRKWFYYEIKPSINFHKDHDYAPSYGIRFSFDIYFGKYN